MAKKLRMLGSLSGNTAAVQPDYAQNDPTQPDYIKNRTHYAGDLVETLLWDLSELASSFQDSGMTDSAGVTVYTTGGYSPVTLTIGETYVVTVDGQKYEYVAQDGLNIDEPSVVIGDFDALVQSDMDSFNNMIMMSTSPHADGYVAYVYYKSSVIPTELKLYGHAQEIVKLDVKFLPDETDPTVPEWAKQPTKPTYTLEEIENAKCKDFIITFTGDNKDGATLTPDLEASIDSVNRIQEAYLAGATFYASFNNMLIPGVPRCSTVNNISVINFIEFTTLSLSKNAHFNYRLYFANSSTNNTVTLEKREFLADKSSSSTTAYDGLVHGHYDSACTEKASVRNGYVYTKPIPSTTETWTFTLEDGTEVTKKVVVSE